MIDQPLFDILADKLVENHGASGIVIVAYSRGSAPGGSLKPSSGSCDVASRWWWRRVAKRASRPIYGGGSGGKDLQEAGAIFAGDLSGLKVKILLAVLLGSGMDLQAVRHEIEQS